VIRILTAVARREVVIFLRYPSWVIGALIWPALFPLMYLFASRALAGPQGEGMSEFARVAGTANYAGFIVVGTTAWMWLNMTLWSVGTSLRNEQLRGTLESNWLSPSPRFLVMLGIAAAHAMNFVIFLLIGVLEFVLVLGVRFNPNPAATLAAVLLTIPWVYGLGMAFAALVLIFKEAQAMVFFVRGIFLVFAGISFPVAVLPGWMREVAEWLPLTHSIEALRFALLENASPALLQADFTFLAWAGVALLTAGYVTFQSVDRLTHRTGSVAHH
jgi:ABC-2 type transport system permease protein